MRKVLTLNAISNIIKVYFLRGNVMKRKSGVLLHISSLWGEYSCGSFGKAAFEWIDILKKGGFSVWQTLPFCVPDMCHSPYKSFSAFSLNPFFIDLELLFEDGLLSREELLSAKQKTPYLCEFSSLSENRMKLLAKAAKRFDKWDEADAFFEEFKESENFCRFMALRSANGNNPWQKWTIDTPDEETLLTWRFTQFVAYSQWMKVKEYANKMGISIIGDIPIYVDLDSSDLWVNKELFQLDGENNPLAVAGVPPDYFCEDGQLWGNPLYDWDKMKEDNFAWWKKRISFMTRLFDGVRIDHFRALESYFSIPCTAKTAKEGKWVKGPGINFINEIKKVSGESLIIAEDLGDITEEVYNLVRESGFPGMRVLQFAFLGDKNSPHLPHNYENNSVAYTGTHDNNTLLGFIWEMSDEERKEIFEYCGYMGDYIDGCYGDIFRTMFKSSAGILIMPLQDLLLYGSDTRINTPGRSDDNWGFRITKEQVERIDSEKFRKLNEMYGRA